MATGIYLRKPRGPYEKRDFVVAWFICEDCGSSYSCESNGSGSPRRFCEICKTERRKVSMTRYIGSEKGKAKRWRWFQEHREEALVYRATRMKAHKEEIAAYLKIYWKAYGQRPEVKERRRQSENKRRALRYGSTVGEIDYEMIKVRDRLICCVCGERVNEDLQWPHSMSLSYDHTIPLSLGGPHTLNNLRVCHLGCNIRRGPGRIPVQQILV